MKINAILRDEDIEGLLNLGAPQDEYSNEAVSIEAEIKRLGNGDLTEGQLYDLIVTIWNHSFGPFSDDDLEKRAAAFYRVVEQILHS